MSDFACNGKFIKALSLKRNIFAVLNVLDGSQ